eukprot:TRINITY_DN8524_c0_g1_i5.p1 TRINITY_DN8524_c0_g1~~TRINITY_DN8524_c0_g1_i5.p1  ORF type:complete len:271 (-),score=-25.47 TRINITY_DN8524_c0_g1_i5:654-1466(-)
MLCLIIIIIIIILDISSQNFENKKQDNIANKVNFRLNIMNEKIQKYYSKQKNNNNNLVKKKSIQLNFSLAISKIQKWQAAKNIQNTKNNSYLQNDIFLLNNLINKSLLRFFFFNCNILQQLTITFMMIFKMHKMHNMYYQYQYQNIHKVQQMYNIQYQLLCQHFLNTIISTFYTFQNHIAKLLSCVIILQIQLILLKLYQELKLINLQNKRHIFQKSDSDKKQMYLYTQKIILIIINNVAQRTSICKIIQIRHQKQFKTLKTVKKYQRKI